MSVPAHPGGRCQLSRFNESTTCTYLEKVDWAVTNQNELCHVYFVKLGIRVDYVTPLMDFFPILKKLKTLHKTSVSGPFKLVKFVTEIDTISGYIQSVT